MVPCEGYPQKYIKPCPSYFNFLKNWMLIKSQPQIAFGTLIHKNSLPRSNGKILLIKYGVDPSQCLPGGEGQSVFLLKKMKQPDGHQSDW